jgi:threonine/homoserine/homoserine lactone efflux protein
VSEFLALGMGLGLTAGLTPGPLLALVVAQTLRHGTREGLKTALAPLITDLPIVVLVIVAIAFLSRSQVVVGWISMAGAVFVAYLGIDTIRSRPPDPDLPQQPAKSWFRGAAVNALSPHPYLFWFRVGGPILLRARDEGPAEAAAFILGFYGCLIGSKALSAVLVGRSTGFLRGRAYRAVLALLGAALIAFAFVLTFEGLALVRGGT